MLTVSKRTHVQLTPNWRVKIEDLPPDKQKLHKYKLDLRNDGDGVTQRWSYANDLIKPINNDEDFIMKLVTKA